ncbi:hypothetical protein EVAR_40886_1 [Eumeta japonica]|uniref:Uncharacterized protein n=1 Tax=Eumeta variegata TaxID=151549 RepID=A0A4C1X6T8_EUMVA|nr:hypothetical protein EVAR_40886_1 [Eumeta japonica]
MQNEGDLPSTRPESVPDRLGIVRSFKNVHKLDVGRHFSPRRHDLVRSPTPAARSPAAAPPARARLLAFADVYLRVE